MPLPQPTAGPSYRAWTAKRQGGGGIEFTGGIIDTIV
jgi:hypothetical protein